MKLNKVLGWIQHQSDNVLSQKNYHIKFLLVGFLAMKIQFKIVPLFAALLVVSETFGQQKELNDLLYKAFETKDSSEVYFQKAKALIKTRPDSLTYDYFRFYKNDQLKNDDSMLFYSKKIIPAYIEDDSLNRLRKIYGRLYSLYLRQGNYDKSLFYNQKALNIAEKFNDTILISLHLSDKSNLYHDFEDYKKGVETGKSAYRILKQHNPQAYKYLIFANNVTAINFDDWNKPDSALYYHYKNLELLEKVEDSIRYGFVLNNIGNTLLKTNRFKEAKKMIKRSLAINKIRGVDYNLATNYTNLATIAYKEKNFQLAEVYFINANKHAKLSESIEKIRDVVQEEAKFYKKKGDYKKALEIQEQFYKLRDSVFKNERAAKFAELETKYQTQKKDNQIFQQQVQLTQKDLEVKRKNMFVYGSLGFTLLIAILGYLLYNQQKLKNHQLTKEAELKSALFTVETQNKLQEQRLRISRDLHDSIGAQLTFVISSLDNIKYGFPNISEKLGGRLYGISEFTSRTIYELRDTIWAMNKENITFEDLQVRIANFIEQAENASHSVRFSFNIEKGVNPNHVFTSVHGMNIYRIIQEAINNAVKYARANHIKIDISKTNDNFHIVVSDDGKGFDLEKTEFGNGLNNIKKRAKNAKSKVSIKSEIGLGTVVKLDIKRDQFKV